MSATMKTVIIPKTTAAAYRRPAVIKSKNDSLFVNTNSNWALLFQLALDADGKFCKAEWLGNIIVGAQLKSLFHNILLPHRGEHDNRNSFFGYAFYFAYYLQPAGIRHHHICEY